VDNDVTDGRLAFFSSVRAVMGGPPIYVDATSSIREVAAVLAREGVGAAIVRGEGDLFGIVTERDIVIAIGTGAAVDEIWAGDIATLDLRTVAPTDTVRDVIAVMADFNIRHVPVRAAGELVGVVSARDILAWLEG
jgi:CBS domain-containing protein